MFSALFRYVYCSRSTASTSTPTGSKEEVLFITEDEHSKPLRDDCLWMKTFEDVSAYKREGPRFADGSINWECPCMASGSLVAHRCGTYFRNLYVCMSEIEGDDATVKCPTEFVDWAACMQNMSDARREQMRRNLLDDNKEKSQKNSSSEKIQ